MDSHRRHIDRQARGPDLRGFRDAAGRPPAVPDLYADWAGDPRDGGRSGYGRTRRHRCPPNQRYGDCDRHGHHRLGRRLSRDADDFHPLCRRPASGLLSRPLRPPLDQAALGMTGGTPTVERWTARSRVSVAICAIGLIVLGFGPFLFDANAIDKLTTLFIYVTLAAMWNALAGYGGLVSVGQQAFFGLGAYAAIRLADAGVGVLPALVLAAILVGGAALPISAVMLRLRAGEFAIGMWVVAELAHLLVNLDGLVQGETGTSLIALNAYAAGTRHALVYWLALATMAGFISVLFVLLRSPTGAAIQAVRDDEDSAASVGVRVLATKRLLFVLAATGTAAAGALWLATAITFQPRTYFGVQWTAYMIFMVLVGGLGTFEGPLLGALVFFLIEAWFGGTGVWYLVGLGGTAVLFTLFLPRGIWGMIEARFALRLLPVGYRLRTTESEPEPPGRASP